MMVAMPNETSLEPLISVLKDKTTSSEIKVKTYQTITSYMKDGDSEKFDSFVTELLPKIKAAFQCITADSRSDQAEVAQAALQALGFCIFQDDITKHISKAETELVINTLCDVVTETTEKNTCTRALWCLSKQTFSTLVVEKQIEKIVNAIEHGQCKKKFQSMTVEHEALNALIRLLDQVPTAMASQATKWGPLIYGPTVHAAQIVREKALIAMEKGFPLMLQCQEELSKRLAADLKAEVLISEFNRLMKSGQECHVLNVWMYYVKLLGKALHYGSLINQLLPIVELGFKNPNAKVKVLSYKAWETLIDNFALNPDIISDHKRVKLLMQVFRINNAKMESVAMAKLMAWWHFVIKLGEKITSYFDQVCVPLMHYCVNGVVSPTGLTPGGRSAKHPTVQRLGNFGSPNTPNLNITGTNSPGVPQAFKSVQLKGQEVVAQFIGRSNKDVDNPRPKFTIDEIETEVITGVQSFLKHYKPLIGAVTQGIISIGSDVPDSMLYYLWNCMMTYIKTLVEGTNKKDHTDLFSFFMSSFKDLVECQCLDQNRLLKLFVPVVNLPEKVLSSLAYQIGDTSVLTQGCPALFLIEVLFNHRILETCSSNERFFCLLEKLISYGFSNGSAALSFCQSVMEQLGHKAGNVESKDSLWRMWSIVANPLTETIKKTNEVNQGNNMDHDFTALYTTLTFPVLHTIGDQLSQGTIKTLVKTWAELYTTFSRLAAMVTTIDSNLVCEELCVLILEGLKEGEEIDSTYIECMMQFCEAVAKQLNFTDPPAQSNSLMSTFGRKTDKTMGNLTSFVNVLDKLLKSLNFKTQKCSISAQTYLTTIGVISMLVTHIPSPHIVGVVIGKLASSTGELIKGQCTKTQGKTFGTQFNQKIERLWMDISTALEGRYMGPYDSDLLLHISPLLEATFLHAKRAIKTQTMIFWSATFAKGRCLEYPESIKPVLAKVREKTPIVLPGWDATTISSIEDMPLSQMTQGESQVPVPSIVNAVSPRKEFGSFLNMAVSPKVKKSPLRNQNDGPQQSPTKAAGESAKKKLSLKLGLEDLNSKDFVVISNTPKRKRVLTEHQREVMKEKRGDIPAMYSNVDASMDASLMGQFCTGNTQMESQMSCTPSAESIEITPFLFMKPANPKPVKPEEKQEKPSKVTADNKKENRNKKTQPETAEKQPLMRRRSVRFSDDMDTSSESVSEEKHPNKKSAKEKNKAVLSTSKENLKEDSKSDDSISSEKIGRKNTRKKICEVVSDSDTSIDEGSPLTVSRSSMRIKSRSSKNKSESDSDKDVQKNKMKQSDTFVSVENSEVTKNEEVKLSQNDSIVIIGESELIDSQKAKESLERESVRNKSSISENEQSILCGQTSKTCDIDNTENVSPSPVNKKQLKISDIVSPNSEQYSILLSSEKDDGDKNESGDKDPQNQIRSSLSESDTSTFNFSPQKKGKTSTKELNLKASPLKGRKVAGLKSPEKFKSPRKAVSLEGYSTIDKWFKKSSQPKSNSEDTSILSSSQKTQLTTLFAQESESASQFNKEKLVAPIVMVEDSQQYSPVKSRNSVTSTSSVASEQISVDETPLKESENVTMSNQSGEAVRNLHGVLATSSQIVPDSEVTITGSKMDIKSVSPVGPVVKLHKLSADEIHLYSPSRKKNCESLLSTAQTDQSNEVKSVRKSIRNLITVGKSSDEKKAGITLEPHELDDIIPSSQDSFGFSIVESKPNEVSNNSVDERPFALFSETNSSCTEINDEAMECDETSIEKVKIPETLANNIKENTVKNTESENEIKSSEEEKATENMDCSEEIQIVKSANSSITISIDKVSSVADQSPSEINVDTASQSVKLSSLTEDSCTDPTIINSSIKRKAGRPRKSLNQNESTPLKDDFQSSNETQFYNLPDSQDSAYNTNSGSLADKYRSKRKIVTPKRFDEDAFRKTLRTPTTPSNVSSSSEVSQNDSDHQTKRGRRRSTLTKKTEEQQSSKVTQSNPDSKTSQPLFSSSEKVEVVEIKRKVKKSKGSPANKNKSADNIDVASEVTSTQTDSPLIVENHIEKSTSLSSDSEDNLPLSRIKSVLSNSSNKESINEILESNNIECANNTEETVNNTEETVKSNDIEENDVNKITSDDDEDDDVPLTSLISAADKKKTVNNEELADIKVACPMSPGLLGSQRGKKSGGKKRLSNLLSIDMRTSPINKKSRSNKPVLRVKLNHKGDRLKLKKTPTPKRSKSIAAVIKSHSQSNSNIDNSKDDADSTEINNDNEGDILKDLDQEDSEQQHVNKTGTTNSCDAPGLEKKSDGEPQIQETSDRSKVLNKEEKSELCKTSELDNGKEQQTVEKIVNETSTEEKVPSPVKMTDNIIVGKTSPLKPVSVRSSPPKKGKPFDIPETPTSSMAKTLGLTRADYIMQKSRLLLGRPAHTPSPMVRKPFKQARGCFSEPRKGVKRSSILKTSPKSASPEKTDLSSSPPSTGFKPVNLPRIYSPSASPSAGILKRRRISGDSPADSPSPPSKQRRVSFAESVETRLYERPKARLVGRPSSPRPVSRCLDMPKNTTSPLVTAEQAANQKKVADSQLTQTQDSVKSTQESQLNCKDPIFPELVNCEEPVDQILTQLTSSVWSRGLGQLIRARNITQIGHLSALTEYDVNNLPIKSPKIATVKKALQDFANRLASKSPVDIADALDSSIDSDPGVFETSADLLDEIKQLEDEQESTNKAEEQMSEDKTAEQTNKSKQNTDDKCKSKSDKTKSGDNKKLNKASDKSEASKERDYDNKLKRQSILNGIKSIKDLVSLGELMSLPTHSLIQIQTELNNMMSNVVVALQAKVPMSPNSQSSQE